MIPKICKSNFKSGKNKGKKCTAPAWENGLCGKHQSEAVSLIENNNISKEKEENLSLGISSLNLTDEKYKPFKYNYSRTPYGIIIEGIKVFYDCGYAYSLYEWKDIYKHENKNITMQILWHYNQYQIFEETLCLLKIENEERAKKLWNEKIKILSDEIHININHDILIDIINSNSDLYLDKMNKFRELTHPSHTEVLILSNISSDDLYMSDINYVDIMLESFKCKPDNSIFIVSNKEEEIDEVWLLKQSKVDKNLWRIPTSKSKFISIKNNIIYIWAYGEWVEKIYLLNKLIGQNTDIFDHVKCIAGNSGFNSGNTFSLEFPNKLSIKYIKEQININGLKYTDLITIIALCSERVTINELKSKNIKVLQKIIDSFIETYDIKNKEERIIEIIKHF